MPCVEACAAYLRSCYSLLAVDVDVPTNWCSLYACRSGSVLSGEVFERHVLTHSGHIADSHLEVSDCLLQFLGCCGYLFSLVFAVEYIIGLFDFLWECFHHFVVDLSLVDCIVEGQLAVKDVHHSLDAFIINITSIVDRECCVVGNYEAF